MRIGEWDSDAGEVLVVAEVGNNHEGDAGLATEMLEAAVEAGAGAVKFQTFVAEHYVTPAQEERFARLKRFELTPGEFERLATLAHERGVAFVSTPFDLGSVDVLAPIADALKISSGDNTFLPLLRAAAATRLPLVLSTGLADEVEVQLAKAVVERAWAAEGVGREPGLALLHCVSCYPVPPEDANLAAIAALAAAHDGVVGYSDHTLGIEAALSAVALGARVVEKHFTLDKQFSDFRDHQLSADPEELAQLVAGVRRVRTLLGRGGVGVAGCEEASRDALRRSVAAARDLPAGTVLAWGDVTWVRPGDGIAPGEEWRLLGRRLTRDVAAGHLLTEESVA